MGPQKRLMQFGIVIVLAVIVQLIFLAVDCRRTPVRVVEEFVRNYYYLDPAMNDQLCADLSADGQTVGDYLYEVTQNAAQRGFSVKFVRRMFTELHIHIDGPDDTSARAHVTGQTRTAINPVFMVIGKLFHIGEYHPVDMHLDLVKEPEGWRVCGEVAGLNT